MKLMMGLLALAAWSPCLAAAAEGPEGTWRGALQAAPGVELPLVLSLTRGEGGGWTASMDSPDQGAFGIPFDAVAWDGTTLELGAKGIRAKFRGKLDAAGGRIEGEWTQVRPLPLVLTRAGEGEGMTAVPKALDGTWEGTLGDGPKVQIRVVLKVTRAANGATSVRLDSPDQGVMGLGVVAITLEGHEVAFRLKVPKARFRGTLDESGAGVSGHWDQNGGSQPLNFRKVDKPTESRRPQTPKPPFAYEAEEVSYANEAAGVKLAGTLTKPPGPGPFPAALLITGSGAQDRDESLLGHKPFLVLADALTRRGVAVLRVDDRGVGGSTGSVSESTSEELAGDVLAGIAFLKGRPGIDSRRIGLIGHSEGGIIAPIVAGRSDDVAFLVLMAGTAMPGDQLLSLQRRLILKAAGRPDAEIARQGALLDRLAAAAKGEEDSEAVARSMRAIAREATADLPAAEREALTGGDALIEAAIGQLGTRWFRAFLRYDPRPALAKVRCPVLAINGEKDLQVPPKENLSAIAEGLKAGGNTRFETRELPGLNHLFQTCQTGSPSEYARIEETIAPAALDAIGDWVAGQAGIR